ncbi:Acyl-CoA N-acyltransferase [Artemisia annua]|uniref:Acyl-CoA N-acyltransferase n=1 Tax=Artemisia annua TaxID=35608 RepID=A0A2U1N565_ARTAN|nr:Acyl-CoA N-acyltransferase [Artemisia annua]
MEDTFLGISQECSTRCEPKYVGRYRITDPDSLKAAMDSAGRISSMIEANLSPGPSICSVRRHVKHKRVHDRVSVASGNFLATKKKEVVEGIDYGATGKLSRIVSVGTWCNGELMEHILSMQIVGGDQRLQHIGNHESILAQFNLIDLVQPISFKCFKSNKKIMCLYHKHLDHLGGPLTLKIRRRIQQKNEAKRARMPYLKSFLFER